MTPKDTIEHEGEGAKTITTKVPADTHRKVKVFCAQNGMEIGKFYAQAALERIKALKKAKKQAE